SSPDQIGVAMNNDACVSAELKHNLLLSRAAFDIPTDWRAAGETDQLDAVVGNQYPCVFVGKRKHIERSVWKASLLDSLGEEKCSERRLWRRLQNNRAAAGDGWRHFVSNQIQREIEWCDSGDWADRKPANDPPTPRGELLPIERKIFARDARGFFRSHGECENSALHFSTGRFQRLA